MVQRISSLAGRVLLLVVPAVSLLLLFAAMSAGVACPHHAYWDPELNTPYPADGSTSVPVSWKLAWQDSAPDASKSTYAVYLDTSSPPTTCIARNIPTNVIMDLAGLQPGTVYYWQVVATNDEVRYSSIWQFTTACPTAAARNPQPANGATGVALNAQLSWTGSTTYWGNTVYFDTANPPANVLTNYGNPAGTNPGPLQPGTTYYWQVVTNGPGGSAPGPVWSFTTLTPAVCQPDLTIRNAASGNYEGVGVYNLNGSGQTVAETMDSGDTANFVIRVQNNGNVPDSFVVTVPCDGSGWRVAGYQMSNNSQMQNNIWSTGRLRPGESAAYLITVTSTGSACATHTLTQLITAVSQKDPSKADAVQAVTIVEKHGDHHDH